MGLMDQEVPIPQEDENMLEGVDQESREAQDEGATEPAEELDAEAKLKQLEAENRRLRAENTKRRKRQDNLREQEAAYKREIEDVKNQMRILKREMVESTAPDEMAPDEVRQRHEQRRVALDQEEKTLQQQEAERAELAKAVHAERRMHPDYDEVWERWGPEINKDQAMRLRITNLPIHEQPGAFYDLAMELEGTRNMEKMKATPDRQAAQQAMSSMGTERGTVSSGTDRYAHTLEDWKRIQHFRDEEGNPLYKNRDEFDKDVREQVRLKEQRLADKGIVL